MTDIPAWDSSDDDPEGQSEAASSRSVFDLLLPGRSSTSSSSPADDDFELESGGFDFDGWLEAGATDLPEPDSANKAEIESNDQETSGFDFVSWLGEAVPFVAMSGDTGAAGETSKPTTDAAGELPEGDTGLGSPPFDGFTQPTPKFAMFAVFGIALVAVGLSIASTAGMFGFEGPDRGPAVAATDTPTPTPTATATATATTSPTPSPTPTVSASPTPTASPSPTPTPTPSPTPTPTPTASPTPSPTPTPTPPIIDLPIGGSSDSGGLLAIAFPLGFGAAVVLRRP